VRCALKASLTTIAASNGYPYASLITVATEASGAPIFLISGLAQHTQNLSQDARASISTAPALLAIRCKARG